MRRGCTEPPAEQAMPGALGLPEAAGFNCSSASKHQTIVPPHSTHALLTTHRLQRVSPAAGHPANPASCQPIHPLHRSSPQCFIKPLASTNVEGVPGLPEHGISRVEAVHLLARRCACTGAGAAAGASCEGGGAQAGSRCHICRVLKERTVTCACAHLLLQQPPALPPSSGRRTAQTLRPAGLRRSAAAETECVGLEQAFRLLRSERGGLIEEAPTHTHRTFSSTDAATGGARRGP